MLATARRVCALTLRAALPSVNVRHGSAYDSEGKTTVQILNKDLSLGIMIDSFSSYGFKLNNGVTIIGPMALFPRTVLSWQVKSSRDVNEDSLRMFTLLEPRIDLLVIALEVHQKALIDPVQAAARRLKLNVEILQTEHACATFNFLTAEGRNVAAAIIPPTHLRTSDDEIISQSMQEGGLVRELS